MGGVIAAIEAGFIQRQIEDSAYEYQRQIETKDRIIVGVNEFQSKESVKVPILKIDKDGVVVGCQKGSLKIFRIQAPSKKEVDIFSYLNGKRLGLEDYIS